MPASRPRPVMLVILDGWGWREDRADNAVLQARTPAFNALWTECPHGFLRTSGADVGLPDGQMGNSEVGHLNIGAGRVVMQDLPRIGRAIADGSIAALPALTGLIAALKASGGTCHLVGLLSPGGVHAHQDHAVALARILSAAGIKVAIHALTDGRDTAPKAAPDFLAKFEADIAPLPGVSIATVIGRYFAMDRDNRWERVVTAHDAMVLAEGAHAPTAQAAIAAGHAAGKTDEFIPATVIGDYAGMQDGDGLLCFNFRADRVREIITALVDPAFDGFARRRVIHFSAAVGMTEYSAALNTHLATLFPAQSMADILGSVAAGAGLTQL
ncbi:MAG TPA: 2,3-bisphosphoglycerate-independent phosphoglycerate mutase, partial [Roseomonas sp.]|nr:2,3-bisphosphoglycerate-independent phosphoglycerate mutase [Roseomonas sp.]